MVDYKEALKLGIRFQTTKGLLSTEQLWGLSQTDLSNLIKVAKKALNKNEDDELSFLEDGVKTADKESQLKFDILKDIYLSKQADIKAVRDEAETKAHNQKILALIARKQENSLEEMSVEDLEKMLK